MRDLIEFLYVRLDEDERAVRRPAPHVIDGASAGQRMCSEIEAWRGVIGECAGVLEAERSRPAGYDEAGRLARQVLRDLAAVYGDHPEYRRAWRP